MSNIIENNLLAKLGTTIDSATLNQVRHILSNLAPPDIAHQLETAPPKFRRILWELIDPEISGEVIQELSDEIQIELGRLNDFLTKIENITTRNRTFILMFFVIILGLMVTILVKW